MRRDRNHLFDALRILFATMVLVTHAFEYVDGNRSREPLASINHGGLGLGDIGVDGFFLLSGFLIIQSWQTDPHLLNYLRKRVLRIVPGYLVAVLLSTLAVGLIAPGVPHFFRLLGWTFVKNTLALNYIFAPPVFPGLHIPNINAALWTIAYEFRCYLVVGLLGVCGLLRRRGLWLGITVVLLFFSQQHLQQPWIWTKLGLVLGLLDNTLRLFPIFFTGACFWLFRDRIRFKPWIAALALACLLGANFFLHARLETAFVLCGGYLLFYLGAVGATWLKWMRHIPDISYGVYLYGSPVLGLILWWTHFPALALFVSATLVCFVLGWLSWHLVERPMLKLKRRPSAPLPAA